MHDAISPKKDGGRAPFFCFDHLILLEENGAGDWFAVHFHDARDLG
jgi:hypothetical protein